MFVYFIKKPSDQDNDYRYRKFLAIQDFPIFVIQDFPAVGRCQNHQLAHRTGTAYQTAAPRCLPYPRNSECPRLVTIGLSSPSTYAFSPHASRLLAQSLSPVLLPTPLPPRFILHAPIPAPTARLLPSFLSPLPPPPPEATRSDNPRHVRIVRSVTGHP